MAVCLTLGLPRAAAAVVVWEVSQGGNGHAYELVWTTSTWPAARVAAGQRTPPPGYGPGHLASISSAAEDAFLWSTLGVDGHVFGGCIGFNDEEVEGEWRWIDATPGIWQDPHFFATPIQTAYVNWSAFEPNNSGGNEDYATFGWSSSDRWNDAGGCETYYVEYEVACDNQLDDDADGLADYPDDPGCSSPTDGSERDPSLVCDNGADDDGDGLTDFPADPGCASSLDDSERGASFACDDGFDNDADGVSDFPDDPGCVDPTGVSEIGECQDGVDNDGDDLIDFPDDPGCADPTGPSEGPGCNDGQDNDGDGLADFPADPGCAGVSDLDERAPTLPCDDGADNDGDGGLDFLAAGGGDPGCASPMSARENPQCQDGINNDYSPGIDFDGGASLNGGVPIAAPDRECLGRPWRNGEAVGVTCGLGFEVVLALVPLALARRRRLGTGAGSASWSASKGAPWSGRARC